MRIPALGDEEIVENRRRLLTIVARHQGTVGADEALAVDLAVAAGEADQVGILRLPVRGRAETAFEGRVGTVANVLLIWLSDGRQVRGRE